VSLYSTFKDLSCHYVRVVFVSCLCLCFIVRNKHNETVFHLFISWPYFDVLWTFLRNVSRLDVGPSLCMLGELVEEGTLLGVMML